MHFYIWLSSCPANIYNLPHFPALKLISSGQILGNIPQPLQSRSSARPIMAPITKLWLCTIKDGKTITDPSFIQLLTDILKLCTSYTNPDTPSPHMHAFYQVVNKPSHLLMITGYPSQELNTEADKVYAEKYLPRLFEYVQHHWLRQLEVDVRQFPLDGERVIVTCDSGPGSGPVEGPMRGLGGWDIWKMTQQGKHPGIVQGVRRDEGIGERVWVQILPWDEGYGGGLGREAEEGPLYLRKIMSG
ncbi:hypothetical protein BDV59DRAFT_183562 [Aspergillus ambiguus]|uniref:uncharacterized protein n=1 Tax=Aspergillus ambiguus TaxID=176160 RepID=UPI003CCD81A0